MTDRWPQDAAETLRELRAFLDDWQRAGLTDLVPSPPPLQTMSAALPADAPAATATGEELGCQGCRRKKCLSFAGPETAELAFVVLAPSRGDVERGQLLSGEAGQLFDGMLRALGYPRDQILCTSVLRCAASSRAVVGEERTACRQAVTEALRKARPRCVVVFGEAAGQALLGASNRLRGRWHEFLDLPLRVTHPPADLVQNPSLKREVWDDLKEVLASLRSAAG